MSGNSLTRAALGVSGLLAAGRALRKRRAISFRDKVVVITGGSRGLGLLIARELAGEASAERSACAERRGMLSGSRRGRARPYRRAVARA